MNIPILSILIFLPSLGALLLWLFNNKAEDSHAAKLTALIISVLNFLLSLVLLFSFKPNDEVQFVERHVWLETPPIHYYLGVDGLSLFFILLSTLLTPLVILVSWNSIKEKTRDFMIAFLVLETMMVGCFAALDLFLFYVFFEGVLIPMFLIIGIFGGENRIKASFKFFLYTLLGSVLMLVAMVALWLLTGSSDIMALWQEILPLHWQFFIFLAFFASFAVKMPMWPVHTWLPDAHVEAPTAGSMILAGVLLKMGGYGFLRLSLPILPDASLAFTPIIFILSAIAVVWASLVALAQTDMKKLIAYSSVAHMGLVTAGIFAFGKNSFLSDNDMVNSTIGPMGAMLQMLSHGVVSAALFFVIGIIYDQTHSRQIIDYGRVADKMPKFAFFTLFFTMASIGLPATSGFIGEFISILAVYQYSIITAACLALGMVLGAAYMLVWYGRVFFGNNLGEMAKKLQDIQLRHWLVFLPLVLITLWLGIYPKFFIKNIEPTIVKLVQTAEQKLQH